MSVSKIGLTFLDASLETSRVDVCVPVVSAATIEAVLDHADVNTAGHIAAAMAALSLCTAIQSDVQAVTIKEAQTPPGSLYAQRELGLAVTYSDTVTGKSYRITIPGPDLANLALAGTDQVKSDAVAWTNFKTVFEAECVSPDGNAVTVTGGRFVGRNR